MVIKHRLTKLENAIRPATKVHMIRITMPYTWPEEKKEQVRQLCKAHLHKVGNDVVVCLSIDNHSPELEGMSVEEIVNLAHIG